ncbi:MAG: hypothetical protein ACTHMS_04580 [Jatrophihabitans sp.]|uniref:hypothetical protein n=1 Tax=Jatrophihabitans sp. TaxID=1932789 RepID=UPI003F81419F
MIDTIETQQDASSDRRRRRLGGRLGLAVAVVLATVGITFVGASPASAFARGCAFWNPFTVSGQSLASGQYCAEVDGTGTYIYNVYGNFGSAANVCNWDLTAEFFDQNWNWKRTYVSAHNYGCSHTGSASIYLPYYLSQITGTNYGYMCSTLRAGGQRITSVCHYIHP